MRNSPSLKKPKWSDASRFADSGLLSFPAKTSLIYLVSQLQSKTLSFSSLSATLPVSVAILRTQHCSIVLINSDLWLYLLVRTNVLENKTFFFGKWDSFRPRSSRGLRHASRWQSRTWFYCLGFCCKTSSCRQMYPLNVGYNFKSSN